jgi:hypothetical protein
VLLGPGLLQGLLLQHGVFGEIDIDGYARAAATCLTAAMGAGLVASRWRSAGVSAHR